MLIYNYVCIINGKQEILVVSWLIILLNFHTNLTGIFLIHLYHLLAQLKLFMKLYKVRVNRWGGVGWGGGGGEETAIFRLKIS